MAGAAGTRGVAAGAAGTRGRAAGAREARAPKRYEAELPQASSQRTKKKAERTLEPPLKKKKTEPPKSQLLVVSSSGGSSPVLKSSPPPDLPPTRFTAAAATNNPPREEPPVDEKLPDELLEQRVTAATDQLDVTGEEQAAGDFRLRIRRRWICNDECLNQGRTCYVVARTGNHLPINEDAVVAWAWAIKNGSADVEEAPERVLVMMIEEKLKREQRQPTLRIHVASHVFIGAEAYSSQAGRSEDVVCFFTWLRQMAWTGSKWEADLDKMLRLFEREGYSVAQIYRMHARDWRRLGLERGQRDQVQKDVKT